jgi:hypothetical protein
MLRGSCGNAVGMVWECWGWMWLWKNFIRNPDKKAKVRVRELLSAYQDDTSDKTMTDTGFSQALAYNNVRVSKAGVMYAREIERQHATDQSDDDDVD